MFTKVSRLKSFVIHAAIILMWEVMLTSTSMENGPDDCLGSLRVLEVSDTRVSLAWAYCDMDNLQTFKIYYEHIRYLACKEDERRDRTKPAGFGTLELKNDHVVIHDLHPHSEYAVRVKALIGGGSRFPETNLRLTTLPGIPHVHVAPSRLDWSYKNGPNSLHFDWSPPDFTSKCHLFFSDLGWYYYRLFSTDPWNKAFYLSNNMSLTETSLHAKDLRPFSHYVLHVYVTNSDGEFDEDFYLKLEGDTLAGPPEAPTVVEAEFTGSDSIHVAWQPPYPPTGIVDQYHVRWKNVEREDWQTFAEVPPGDTLCRPEEEATSVCHTITDLEPGNYSVQVRVFNTDVGEPSKWSADVFASPQDYSSVDAWAYILIVVMTLAISVGLFLLLRFAILRHRRRNSKHSGHPAALLRPIVRSQDSTSSTSRYLINDTGNHYTDQLLRDVSFNSTGRRSCQDPLPPVPGNEEHIYSDIKAKRDEDEDDTHKPHSKDAAPDAKPKSPPFSSDNGGGLGKPATLQLQLDEDEYLAPNPISRQERAPSRESLDEEGYLRPNFNRFQRVNTTVATPETPPPVIPPVSYRGEKNSK